MKAADKDDLAKHLLDHYDECLITPCKGMMPETRRGCSNWKPSLRGARRPIPDCNHHLTDGSRVIFKPLADADGAHQVGRLH